MVGLLCHKSPSFFWPIIDYRVLIDGIERSETLENSPFGLGLSNDVFLTCWVSQDDFCLTGD